MEKSGQIKVNIQVFGKTAIDVDVKKKKSLRETVIKLKGPHSSGHWRKLPSTNDKGPN